jgi:Staphylococcal nuclease homologue
VRGQGTTFNETLLRQGYAQLYIVSPNDRYEARFRQAQDHAKWVHRGIWGLPKNQQCELANRGNGIGEDSQGVCSKGSCARATGVGSGSHRGQELLRLPEPGGGPGGAEARARRPLRSGRSDRLGNYRDTRGSLRGQPTYEGPEAGARLWRNIR